MRKSWISAIAAIALCLCIWVIVRDFELPVWEQPNIRNPASESSRFAWVAKVPFSDRLDDYLSALGVKKYGAGHSGANEGLASFNNALLKGNSCFAELTTRFVDEVRIMDLEQLAKRPANWNRPKISDHLSKDSSPPAGFLWDLAMKYSKQDPNLAMSLIGVCGHDDAVSVDVALSDYVDPKVSTRKHRAFNAVMSSYQNFKAANQGLAMPESEFREMLGRYIFKPGCPSQMSLMFQPQALGLGVDIPDTLKIDIAKVQAPTLGASALPAKAYHVIAGATSSCLLYQRGIPSLFASEIHKRAVNAYRSATICRLIQNESRIGESVATNTPISWNDVKVFAHNLKTTPAICQNPTSSITVLCSIVQSNSRYRASDLTESTLANRLSTALARADAGLLVTKSKKFSALKACAEIDMHSNLESIVNSIDSSNCPLNWTQDKCQAAVSATRTWATDFEWTRAQHMAGERFARENCHLLSGGKDRLENACNALESVRALNSGSTEPPTAADRKTVQ